MVLRDVSVKIALSWEFLMYKKKSKDPKRYLWYGKQIIFEEDQKQEPHLL